METFADFAMCGKTARQILESLPRSGPGWYLNVERSNELSSKLRKECFNVSVGGGELYPAAEICFLREGEDCFEVTNVVPAQLGQLTKVQYNQILLDFYNAKVRPLEGAELSTAPPRGHRDVSEYLDEEGVVLLRTFSAAANKSTGASHPLDFQRWAEFISDTFRKNQILPHHALVSALIDEGWQDDSARELANQYEVFIQFLRVFAGGS